jgi:hypothetical protein
MLMMFNQGTRGTPKAARGASKARDAKERGRETPGKIKYIWYCLCNLVNIVRRDQGQRRGRKTGTRGGHATSEQKERIRREKETA